MRILWDLLRGAIIEWSAIVFIIATTFCVLVLIFFGFFRRTRPFATMAILVGSWIAGAVVWVLSALLTYIFWGVGWLIAGIALLGVGVFPMALIASGRAGEWGNFRVVASMMAVTIALRLIGMFLMGKD